ncbi:hypothetical protein [Prosthecobacter sp.]|uniref:hypothetical protein n=1 Tax=Prosthecobacter sp. TaxID=1965333 RepID=UPI002ABB0BF5|nr:hypothetical protein [Prosthecobacter sp.]MDZ4401779.1 hypothetical protein [Prosthecobacter sp.]
MKNTTCPSFSSLLFIASLTTASVTFSQNIEATATSTTSEGTVSEFGPQGIIIKTATGTQPVRYISNETTNFVDENGNPISATLVTSGLPVTVYYTKVGDTLIASKIMVRTGVAAPARILETTQTMTMSAGTISEFGPERIIIQTESSPTPLPYTYSKTTTYVDESGAPVSIETVKSGLPVTVYYTKVGNTLVANKVIMRKAVAVPLIETKKTTTITTETK